ncbi:MAG TPA: hypothetical protein VJU59_04565 [Paraburkholderia sp.]|uniref:hypothetical protein n=1 Tax=Paraburkholderia sp. TaxID=1926495 RepID=UPI002B48C0B4|nr:hypothetical protein [Paraburkholderia sp.]HKR38945.1 hypothetical protein [Paraburkholderia sp.]
MTIAVRFYRGLEIYPLVYPHRPTAAGFCHNYDEGFDAAVRILEPLESDGIQRSRVFSVVVSRPFINSGDARRASIEYAERLIDTCSPGATFLDMKS